MSSAVAKVNNVGKAITVSTTCTIPLLVDISAKPETTLEEPLKVTPALPLKKILKLVPPGP